MPVIARTAATTSALAKGLVMKRDTPKPFGFVAVGTLAFGGQHQDRNRLRGRIGPHGAQNVKTGHARQHQVQNDHIGRRSAQTGQGAGAIPCHIDLPAIAGQDETDGFGNVALILDHENAFTCHVCPLLPRPAPQGARCAPIGGAHPFG
jgi:hypothetical protein